MTGIGIHTGIVLTTTVDSRTITIHIATMDIITPGTTIPGIAHGIIIHGTIPVTIPTMADTMTTAITEKAGLQQNIATIIIMVTATAQSLTV